MPQPTFGGPLDEPYLRHQLRLHPLHLPHLVHHHTVATELGDAETQRPLSEDDDPRGKQTPPMRGRRCNWPYARATDEELTGINRRADAGGVLDCWLVTQHERVYVASTGNCLS